MKKTLLYFCSLMAIFGCQIDELAPVAKDEVLTDGPLAMYTVGMEDDNDIETRTSLDYDEKTILWSEGDQMNIFFGVNNNDKDVLTLKGPGGSKTGKFYGPYISSEDDVENLHQAVIVYPFDEANTCEPNETKTEYTVGLTVPAVQNYVVGSMDNGALAMIGVTEKPGFVTIKTQNVVSGLKLYLKGEKKISKVVVAAEEIALAGPAKVLASYNNPPVITITEGETASNKVVMECGDGVQLNNESVTGFYLTFAPCVSDGKLSVTVYDTEGGYMTIPVPAGTKFERSKFSKATRDYVPTSTVQNDLVNAFKSKTVENYTLPIDVTVDVQLPLTDKTFYLDLNGNTLNLGGTQSQTQGHIKNTKGYLYISNGTITGKQNYMFVTSKFNAENPDMLLDLTDVNVICTGGTAVFGFPGETNVKLNNVNVKSTKPIFYAFNTGSKGRVVIDGGRFESSSKVFSALPGKDFTIPVTFNGDCRFSDESYTLVRWNKIEGGTCPYVPESYVVFVGEDGFYTLTDAIDAAQDGDIVVLKNGTYEGLFYVDGKSVTIKAENAGQATINGKLAIAASGKTVNVEGIVFENSYAGSVNVGHQYLDKTGKYCIGLYCASVNVDNCTFNLATDGGINFYAINAPDRCTVTNCTFNANGFRPIISKANLTVDNCTFNDQNKYALQVWGNQNTGDESVLFTNNEIVNAGKTSGVSTGLLSYVSISGSYAINNVDFTIKDNTPGYHFIYDDKANVKITECSFNGKTIVPEQCVSIVGVSGTKQVLNYEDVCVAFVNGEGFVTLTDALKNTTGDVVITVKEGDYTLPSALNQTAEARTVTIKGAGKDATNLIGSVGGSNNPGNYANGLNLKFQDVTFTTANSGYSGGFGHAATVEFTDSKIVGQYYAHSGAYHKFENCTIDPLNGYLYTYASDCDFINCDFAASQGKALQVYEDASNGENVVNIKGCRFVAAKQAATRDGKPVTGIDINSNGNTKFVVNIDNCTTTGFPTGLNSGSDLWNVKNVNGNISVYVDGKLMVGTVAQLQKALDNDATAVYFSQDITGNVKVTQKADVNVVIDGNGKKFAGIMTTFGNGRQSGAETLTIKNIKFEAANGADACIVSPDRSVYGKYSYSHNVTVEACTFTDPDGGVNCAAVRQNDGGDKNLTIKGCTVDNTMHSILQVNNVAGVLNVDNCTVASKNGANLNSSTNVVMKDCQFDVKGYAVRFGVNSGGNLGEAKTYTIENSTLKSECNDGDAVIIFRASAVDATLNLVNTTLLGTTEISGATSATTINR